ncbi:MAG: hypothetical protein IJ086_00460 [Clostridium sp.]|nr:hypothetical protein [Clostridium sp.]
MRKGIINKGFIKKTYKQKKKHYTQLTGEEFEYLESKLKELKEIKPSWHLVEKNDILIKKLDVFKVLNDKNLRDLIIEFNITPNKNGYDKRALLRSRDVYNVNINNNSVKCNLCFVISILKGEVVTAYYNEVNDNHDSIDWNRYDKDLKVI